MAELIGEEGGFDYVQSTQPSNPSIGETWLDTSQDPPVAKVYADVGGGASWQREEVSQTVVDRLDIPVSEAKPSPLPAQIQAINSVSQLDSDSLWNLFAGKSAPVQDVTILGSFDHRGVLEVFRGGTVLVDGGNWDMEDSNDPELTAINSGTDIIVKNSGELTLRNVVSGLDNFSIDVDSSVLEWFATSNNITNINSVDVKNSGTLDVSGDLINSSGDGVSFIIGPDSTAVVQNGATVSLNQNNSIIVDSTITINGTFSIDKGSTKNDRTTISGDGAIEGDGFIGVS